MYSFALRCNIRALSHLCTYITIPPRRSPTLPAPTKSPITERPTLTPTTAAPVTGEPTPLVTPAPQYPTESPTIAPTSSRSPTYEPTTPAVSFTMLFYVQSQVLVVIFFRSSISHDNFYTTAEWCSSDTNQSQHDHYPT